MKAFKLALKIVALWVVIWIAILITYLVLSGHSLAEHGGGFFLVLTIILSLGGGVVHTLSLFFNWKFFGGKLNLWFLIGSIVNLVILVPMITYSLPHDSRAIIYDICVAALLYISAFVVDFFLERKTVE